MTDIDLSDAFEEENRDESPESAGPFYYKIWSIDDEGIIDFVTSDRPEVVEDCRQTPSTDVLWDTFRKYYDRKTMQSFDFGAAENSHNFTGADSPEAAEEFAAGIAWVFENEGFRPMTMVSEIEIAPREPAAGNLGPQTPAP